ncbi:MAG: hypothetical protein ACHQAY_14430 [Hyphomicrobiales bacterium]
MRNIVLIGLGLALAGCVSTQPVASPEELRARSEQATAQCRSQPLTSYVARAQCLNDAAGIAASVAPNPDLLQRALAARLEIAQRVDDKKITPEQGGKEYAKLEAQLAAEASQR